MLHELRPCGSDPFGLYATTYDSLVTAADRDALLRDLRVSHRCCRVRADCALAQALADVARGVPKRSRAHFVWMMEQLRARDPGE